MRKDLRNEGEDVEQGRQIVEGVAHELAIEGEVNFLAFVVHQ